MNAEKPPTVFWQKNSFRFSLCLGLLAVITAAAYCPAARCGFIWDDETYVLNNQTLRSAEGLYKIWFDYRATPQYYPMVHTSYWFEYHLWGLNPLGYHVTNIVLHIIAAVLLWRIGVFLKIPAAWTAAAVFALHPVGVESVAWITERKNVLSAVFYFASALIFLRRSVALDSRHKQKRHLSYALSLLLFVLALLSKTVTATLPVVLLLVLWYKKRRLKIKDVLVLVPFFAFGLAFGLLTITLEKSHVGAVGAEWQYSFIERLLIAGRAVCFYVSKLLWPAGLTFFYPKWQINPARLWQYLYPVLVVAVFVLLWIAKRRIGAGFFIGYTGFVLTLFPALGFFNVYPMRYSFVADHFQYHASVYIIVPVVCAAQFLITKILKMPKLFGVLIVFIVLAILGALTFRRCLIYKDLETLWSDTIRKNPDAWIAHNNLGTLLMGQGRFDQALEHFNKALELYPDYVEGCNNLAWILAVHPDPDVRDGPRAVAFALRAIMLNKKADANLLDTLAAAYASAGQFGMAVQTAGAALSAAKQSGLDSLAEQITGRLELFHRNKPFIAHNPKK